MAGLLIKRNIADFLSGGIIQKKAMFKKGFFFFAARYMCSLRIVLLLLPDVLLSTPVCSHECVCPPMVYYLSISQLRCHFEQMLQARRCIIAVTYS